MKKFNPDHVYYEGINSFFHLCPVLFFCFHVGRPIRYRSKRLPPYQHRNVRWIHSLLVKFRANLIEFAEKHVSFLLYIKLTAEQASEAQKLFDFAYRQVQSKDDLYNLHFSDVRVGDLIYDQYLMNTRLPTIDLSSNYYSSILNAAVEEYIFWRDLAARQSSKAVVVTHTCYLYAIPARVFIAANKDAYQVNHAGVYRLCRDRQWAYTEYYDFPHIAKTIYPDKLSALKSEAESRIIRRFSGEVGVDMKYSTASAYTSFSNSEKRLIKSSGNIKILIAAHCLFDAPNGWGKNIFPDFYEWLKYLASLSLQTPYDWYIKTHPDFLPGNEDAILDIIQDGNILMLPSNASHHQLISEGISVCLTVYGTIGFEYAALGKTVVNASLDNPHSRYSFNLNVGDKNGYANILLDLGNNLIVPSRDEVLEYYAMKLYTNTGDWFYKDWDKLMRKTGGRVPHSTKDLAKAYSFVFVNLFACLKYWRSLSPQLAKFIKTKSYKFYPCSKT